MLKVNNYGGFGGGGASTDPNILKRFIGVDFTKSIVNQQVNGIINLSGGATRDNTLGLVLTGAANNGADLVPNSISTVQQTPTINVDTTRVDNYDGVNINTWPDNIQSSDGTFECICVVASGHSSYHFLMTKHYSSNRLSYSMVVTQSTGQLYLAISNNGTADVGNYLESPSANGTVPYDTEMHIRGTIQNKVFRGFVNGTLVHTLDFSSLTPSVPFAHNTGFMVGHSDHASYGGSMKGSVKKVRCYKGIALSTASFQALTYNTMII